jgi:hypothetical protein
MENPKEKQWFCNNYDKRMTCCGLLYNEPKPRTSGCIDTTIMEIVLFWKALKEKEDFEEPMTE